MRWGDEELAVEKMRKRRLNRLGHVARMPDHRLPKSLLFGWLPESCPRCGTRRRWRDVIRKDFKDISITESGMKKRGRSELDGGQHTRIVWPTTVRAGQSWQCVRWSVRFASGCLRRRVTGKDTSVWQRGRSLSVNNVGQPSARSVNLCLGAEVGWQSIYADR